MKLLGLRLCEHDSNISYYDGKSIRYTKTERTYQEKHRGEDNLNSWKWEIKKLWGIEEKDIDEIGVIISYWRYNIPKIENIFPAIKCDFLPTKTPTFHINHHYAHALSISPTETHPTDVDIVIDGRGELNVSFTIFKKGKLIDEGLIEKNGSVGHSLEMLGRNYFNMEVSPNNLNQYLDISGKLMGLQSYGNLDKGFLEVLKDYSIYNINKISNFDLWADYKKDNTLGELTRLDWLHTLHYKFGEIILDLFKKYCSPTDVISYTGGVAQNVIWNTLLKKHFPNLIVLPHSSDEGLSLGAIEFLRRKNNLPVIPLKNFPYCQTDESPNNVPSLNTIKEIAKLLFQGKTIGWYQGNGEIGPRALGNRSILFNPLISNGKEIVNQIKKRENYRPFGATVLEENSEDYFDFKYSNPHMLYVGKVKDPRLQSITHVDGTCRFQTINKTQNPLYYSLIKEFEKLSGVPILLNTSLNVNGKPIAAYEDNARELLYSSYLDYLVIGNKIISKT